jgi:YHS domain-containing protein
VFNGVEMEPSVQKEVELDKAGKAMTATTDSGVKDPVCGMTVDPNATSHRHTYQGRSYYFCSAGCQGKFVAHPTKYLAEQSVPVQEVPKGTIYTCPMHPQIRQVGPGNCPICGMTLEPVTATAEVGPNRELVDMTRRFWVGLVLTFAGLDTGNGDPYPRSWTA